MSATDWILWLAGAALLAALALLLYARREHGGARRFLPAGLRAAALALALLLVFDPYVPGIAAGTRGGPVLILDDSWSMRLPGVDGSSRWAAALEVARATGIDRVMLLSGETIELDELERREPTGRDSRVAPALRAALESGAREVILVTDGGVTDADDAARLLAGAGAAARVESVGNTTISNAAVAGVDAPGAAAAGDSVDVRVDIAALGLDGDSLRVTLHSGADMLDEAVVSAPGDGRIATADLTMRLPGGASDQRLTVTTRVARVDAREPDAFAEDDARPFFVDVQARPRGIVLLSLRPDWEPRFLLPVLERSSGLPVRGYIRTPAGTYLTIGTGGGVARRVAESDVRADLERAAVAVLHGVGGGAPAWVRDRLNHPRLLVFPIAAAEAGALPGPLGIAAGGPIEAADWYVDDQPPASPVASLLAELSLAELPPLTSLRGANTPEGTWTPLVARRDRRGTPRPLAIAGGGDARRYIVATGTGYWRWALRGGDARRAYGLFWSSMLGWLTEGLGAEGGDPIRPEPGVVERGDPIVWYVAGDAETLHVRLSADGGESTVDTTIEVGADRTGRTAPLEPGVYRWQATAGETSASGELAVAAWSPEMVRATRDLSSLSSVAATIEGGSGSRRRLHASAWPWLLLVGMLCGEWIARRRLGLR